MFQLRVKTGFNRGLGTEAITHLKDCMSTSHQSLESIGVCFQRNGAGAEISMQQLWFWKGQSRSQSMISSR
jgi:hypothetical protein